MLILVYLLFYHQTLKLAKSWLFFCFSLYHVLNGSCAIPCFDAVIPNDLGNDDYMEF